MPHYLMPFSLNQQTMAKSLALFLLALFAFSASADVFVSIDCGASGFYTDENSIVWTGDDTFTQIGQSQVVQSNTASHVMSTLRVFTSRKKNCYSIPADKGGQVLVRASFFYGNYDKKSSPPTFDLHFDGNYWDTVKTSQDGLVYYEVTYVIKGDSISVCLAQTQPNQFPFISALEVRSLGSSMYSHVDSNYALFLRGRYAFGANTTIRYIDDPYDRIWVPGSVGSGLTVVTSDATIILGSDAPDIPPQAALENAITTALTSDPISLIPGLPAQEVPIYMNMYFSEVTFVDSTQKRSFEIYRDNKPDSSAIIPPYGSVTEMYYSNITASANTTFSLVATPDSALPPLINAMEVFVISDPLTDGTNSNDVQGLTALVDGFSELQDWAGDPCLPSPYTWDWVNCSSEGIPRVTALYLSGYQLSGSLPDFSSMDALVTIDLHNNKIDGPIPDFLGNFPNLRALNLANNAFSGSIPSSITSNKNLKLVVTGNPDLCASGNSCSSTTSTGGAGSSTGTSSGSSGKKSKLPVILGSTVPAFAVFWAIVGTVIVMHQKRKRAAIDALNAGEAGKPNGISQAQQGTQNDAMMGKIGEVILNEIKVNIQDQLNTDQSTGGDQSDPSQAYQPSNGTTNN